MAEPDAPGIGGEGDGTGVPVGDAVGWTDGAAEGAVDAFGALDNVGPSVQPAPTVELAEQAATKAASPATEMASTSLRALRWFRVALVIGSSAPLPGFALGLGRRGVDHLDPLHLADRSRAERGHRLAKCADEVL